MGGGCSRLDLGQDFRGRPRRPAIGHRKARDSPAIKELSRTRCISRMRRQARPIYVAVTCHLVSGLNMRKFLAVLVISSWASFAHAQKADLIVTNAKIVTLDPASTIAQALAVREGKI